jgi:uncharacterized protein (TIGR03067 family)
VPASFSMLNTLHVRDWLAALLAISSSAAAFVYDDPAKNELVKHQGVWVATSSTFNGEQAPAEILHSIKRTVRGDHVVWERDGKSFAGTTIKLHPTQDPRAIDVIPDGGRNRGEHVRGIYKLEGNTLTICMASPSQPRPTEFKAGTGRGCVRQTFRREP